MFWLDILTVPPCYFFTNVGKRDRNGVSTTEVILYAGLFNVQAIAGQGSIKLQGNATVDEIHLPTEMRVVRPTRRSSRESWRMRGRGQMHQRMSVCFWHRKKKPGDAQTDVLMLPYQIH